MSVTTSTNYAGKYEVKELLIKTSSGSVLDLKNSVQAIDIYESIFSTSLSGSITILDVHNIAANGPIIGQEFMSLKLTTPNLDNQQIDFTDTTFCIYKIISRTSASISAQIMTLSFTTPEALRDKRTRVSKSYTDDISDIVRKVLKDQRYINTNKNVFIEPTQGVRKVVSPNIHPNKLITTLATEAISKEYGSPHFMFFENTKGIHFKSVENMLKGVTHGKYLVEDLGPLEERSLRVPILTEMFRVLEFQINSNNDMLVNIQGGMLGSKTIEYNIYNKTYSSKEYKHFDNFNDFPRLEGEQSNPVFGTGSIDALGNTVGDFSDSRIHLHPVNTDGVYDTQHTNETLSYRYTPDKINESILKRQAKFMELRAGVSVSLKITGNTTIAAGDMINIVVPTAGKTHKNKNDPQFTGIYLITTLRHSFDQTTKKHEIYLTAAKDSFSTGYSPSSESGEPLGKEGAIRELTY
jgi:hypothetical protein